MRVFELSTRLSAVSRAKTAKFPNGRRTTAMIAYRAGCAMSDELTGESWDYTPKAKGVAHSEIFTIAGAPGWMSDRQKVWNAIEAAEERNPYKDRAQPAKEIMFSFADEISAAGRVAVLADVAKFLMSQGAAIVDGNIHSPGKAGDRRNWHAHVMFPTRLFNGEKFIKKAAWQVKRAEGKEFAKALRKFIADRQNQQLAAEGKAGAVRVEFKSFKARGSSQTPTQHMGVAKTNAVRREKAFDREAWVQKKVTAQKARQVSENKKLREQQNADWRKLSQRQAALKRQKAQELVREARAARRQEATPTALKSLLWRLTGKSERIQAERKERASERLKNLRQELQSLKNQTDREKLDMRQAQKSERDALKERHSAQNSKLSEAFRAKDRFDRTAIVSERQSPAREQDNQQEIERDRGVDHKFRP